MDSFQEKHIRKCLSDARTKAGNVWDIPYVADAVDDLCYAIEQLMDVLKVQNAKQDRKSELD